MLPYNPNKQPTLIIGGGVGPMAGVELHRKIIENTRTKGFDQDHLDVIHISAARTIGDRTDYLLGTNPNNPGPAMAAAVGLGLAGLLNTKGKLDSTVVVGVPCNTFHAPQIYQRFMQELSDFEPQLKAVHMLRETISLIRSINPDAARIGLMSTTGTRESGVWSDLLTSEGYSVLEVPEDEQALLHEAIYNSEWGLKAVTPASDEARNRMEGFCSTLIDSGAEMVILGCTEIPLALPMDDFEGTPLVDPMLALARGMIRTADESKLRSAP